MIGLQAYWEKTEVAIILIDTLGSKKGQLVEAQWSGDWKRIESRCATGSLRVSLRLCLILTPTPRLRLSSAWFLHSYNKLVAVPLGALRDCTQHLGKTTRN